MLPLTKLCQLNGGCLGCCGHDFVSKSKIQEALRLNTQEFLALNPQTKAELLQFRNRAESYDLRFGVCRNIIEQDGRIFCPLHPLRNNGEDLRLGHCDPDHLCRTAKQFNSWPESKQQQFLEFVASKNLDPLDYSLKIDRGELWQEFEAQYS